MLLSLLNNEISRPTLRVLTLSFLGSNFFLWHFQVGHVSQIITLWGIGVIYFCLKSLYFPLTLKQIIASNFLVFSIYSAGFYHGVMYLLFPFYFSLCLLMIFHWIQKKHFNLKDLIFTHLVGLVLSSYKFIGILIYQLQFPRMVHFPKEILSLGDLLINQALPTIHYKYLNLISHHLPWSIWESSVFCLNFFIFFLCLLRPANACKKLKCSPYFHWIIIYLVVVVIYSMGEFSFWSPVSLLNHYLLNHSLQAIGRFQIGISFLITLICGVLWQLKSPRYQHIFILLLLLNLSTFLPGISTEQFKIISHLKIRRITKMTKLTTVKNRKNESSFMYKSILAGKGVYNCYNAISLTQKFISEKSPHFLPYQQFNFINSANEDCLKKSYFTQNNLHIDNSCDHDYCLNLNNLNQSEGHRLCEP